MMDPVQEWKIIRAFCYGIAAVIILGILIAAAKDIVVARMKLEALKSQGYEAQVTDEAVRMLFDDWPAR